MYTPCTLSERSLSMSSSQLDKDFFSKGVIEDRRFCRVSERGRRPLVKAYFPNLESPKTYIKSELLNRASLLVFVHTYGRHVSLRLRIPSGSTGWLGSITSSQKTSP